jgi:hypothetical protein
VPSASDIADVSCHCGRVEQVAIQLSEVDVIRAHARDEVRMQRQYFHTCLQVTSVSRYCMQTLDSFCSFAQNRRRIKLFMTANMHLLSAACGRQHILPTSLSPTVHVVRARHDHRHQRTPARSLAAPSTRRSRASLRRANAPACFSHCTYVCSWALTWTSWPTLCRRR